MPKKIIFLLSALWCLYACNPKVETSLSLATYTYSTNTRLENLKPLQELLQKELGVEVKLTSYPDVATFVSAIRSNEVDIALINTLGYLQLASKPHSMTMLGALKVFEDASDNYKTAFLTRYDLSRDDLEKESSAYNLTLVSPGSTSGNLIPRLFLNALGLKPETDFADCRYAGNHALSLTDLLEGKTDFCALGSNEYFKQVAADSSILKKSKLLWLSPEIPLGPVLLHESIQPELTGQLRKLFMDLHVEEPIVLKSVKAGWTEAIQAERYIPITDSYYDSLRYVNNKSTGIEEILQGLE